MPAGWGLRAGPVAGGVPPGLVRGTGDHVRNPFRAAAAAVPGDAGLRLLLPRHQPRAGPGPAAGWAGRRRRGAPLDRRPGDRQDAPVPLPARTAGAGRVYLVSDPQPPAGPLLLPAG